MPQLRVITRNRCKKKKKKRKTVFQGTSLYLYCRNFSALIICGHTVLGALYYFSSDFFCYGSTTGTVQPTSFSEMYHSKQNFGFSIKIWTLAKFCWKRLNFSVLMIIDHMIHPMHTPSSSGSSVYLSIFPHTKWFFSKFSCGTHIILTRESRWFKGGINY